MKAILDHIGIAVNDLDAALRFYRDALGLDVEAPEEVPSQKVRARFVPVGQSSLELLQATAPDSPIAKFVEKRGPGLHHITLRVEDIHAALAQLKARGATLVDDSPRPGAEGALVAFIHPSSAHGVLVELKQPRGVEAGPDRSVSAPRVDPVVRHSLGDLELISVSDGYFRLDGGSMFGVIPKTMWSSVAPADERNRIRLSMRPLVVRGARTMIIDAGMGDKESEKFHRIYGVERLGRHLDHSLAQAGLSPEDIDIVLASHLHFDHAGGFTDRDARGHLRPHFPRAQYIVRRGEWEDATHPTARTRASYLLDNYVPLAQAGVLQLVEDDQTIMPGVRVRRTGGHTPHHQMVIIESAGKTAAFVADLIPTSAHLPDVWVMGYDLFPLESMAAKQRFVAEAIEKNFLVFFEHDPSLAAGYLREDAKGTRSVRPGG
ncbi:MAG TPA: methylmalonyl-CoA epimerase [Vicinamibacterales bacterium]|nr:methylmalonyl-CoA epimerase [Vicinamibacterales bacterium]